MSEKKEYKLADSVSMRLVQIFQEAMMTGVDGADLLRQVRLEVDASMPDTLVMSNVYKNFVTDSHQSMIEKAKELQG